MFLLVCVPPPVVAHAPCFKVRSTPLGFVKRTLGRAGALPFDLDLLTSGVLAYARAGDLTFDFMNR